MNFSGKKTMNSYGFRQSLTHGKVCSHQFLLPPKFHEDNVGLCQAGTVQSGLCQSLQTLKHLILEMAAGKPAHPSLWRQSSFGGVCFLPWEVRANLLYVEVGGRLYYFWRSSWISIFRKTVTLAFEVICKANNFPVSQKICRHTRIMENSLSTLA